MVLKRRAARQDVALQLSLQMNNDSPKYSLLLAALIMLLFLLLGSFTAAAQDRTRVRKPSFAERKTQVNKGFQFKSEQPTLALLFLSGAANGLEDVLQFHYADFRQVHPNANEQWWNPELSWRNKYKNGDPAQGRRFPGSTSVLVATTDAWHLAKATRLLFMATALAISPKSVISPYEENYKRGKFTKTLLFRTLAYLISYQAGAFLVYDVIYSNKR